MFNRKPKSADKFSGEPQGVPRGSSKKVVSVNNSKNSLNNLRLCDRSTNKAVCDFLESNKQLKVFVCREGNIHASETIIKDKRLRILVGLVRDEELSQKSRLFQYTPIEFDSWVSRQKMAGGTQAAKKQKATNQSATYLLDDAIKSKASDIDFMIMRDKTIVYHRIYGYMKEKEVLSKEIGLACAQTLFNRGENSGVFEQSSPCDHAFSHIYKGKEYRVRVNSLPHISGVRLSCRIRDPKLTFDLSGAGYSPMQERHIQSMARASGGIFMITGETNSGKSTTLAGLMKDIPLDKKMIEIADPCEVEFDHCVHVELNRHQEHAEDKLNGVLAATVRQDPDILVLGEIRDKTTAIASMNMAIQGKLVLTTLHTQTCESALPRLSNLGVDDHLFALREFIAGIISQNLVPKLCQNCSLPDHPDNSIDERYKAIFDKGLRFRNPTGCCECSDGIPGVIGQTVVAEVYPLSLDSSGKTQEVIESKKFYKLGGLMNELFGVVKKEEHAKSKVNMGLIDPYVTAGIIGEFSGVK